MRGASSAILAVLVLAAAPAVAKDPGSWRYAVSKGGKVTGRLDLGVAKRDGTEFAVAGFYAGANAVKSKAKAKPAERSYAELEADGTLGKYKRWIAKGKGDQYWFAFVFEGKVKVRYEKGLGDKGKVKELGEAAKVVPLDPRHPHLAWLLAGAGKPASVACVRPEPAALGKASVSRSGSESVDLYGGGKATLEKWVVTGDCGEYAVYVDAKGEPIVMVAAGQRYDRIQE